MAGLPPALVSAIRKRYVIERELGHGGMATVYLAHDRKHDRPVAFKVLRPELASSLGPERFLHEIHITAKLQHPHILPVFDSGKVDDGHRSPILWYTMPYVEGETLRERLLREKQLPVPDALQIAAEVADALEYAHSQGIIHRDIKPENIMLSRGHAMVGDFGIAKALAPASEHLTSTGLAIGTPAYMSPEQATGGENLDARSDLYSLGCVLYEMLAGVPPFAGPTPQSVVAQHLVDPPPSVGRLRDDVPVAIDRLIQRALAKSPEDRIGSGTEFALALRSRHGAEAASLARPATSRLMRTRGILMLGAVLVAALGGGGLLISRVQRDPVPAESPKLIVLPFENLGPEKERYFVDGVTDEITSRLATVGGLRVVARSSANHYRNSDQPISRIGKEVGADYALDGSARWERGSAADRVRINARLIRISDGLQIWTESYDAVLAGIFQLQSDIAEKVVQGLHITLLEPARRRLAAQPTSNLQAYDYLLQGKRHMEGWVERDLRIAVQMFDRAIALDSGFAVAHALLARVHAKLYWHDYDRTPARLAKAKAAAERALGLAPDLPEAHLAMGYYHYWGSFDYDRALQEFDIARKGEPNNSDLFQAMGSLERRRGRYDVALRHQELAVELDPKSVEKAEGLAFSYYLMRRYEEAERVVNRAITLGPDQYQLYGIKILTYLSWRADVAQAMAVLQEAAEGIPVQELVDQLAPYFGVSFFKILDSALSPEYRRALDHISPEAFGSDSSWYFLVRASWSQHRGVDQLARAYFDSARVVLQAEVAADSSNAQAHSGLGLAYAGLGLNDEAVREGELARDLVAVPQDALAPLEVLENLAHIYLIAGKPEQAINQLETLLVRPGPISGAWLSVDPRWKSLRGNPRFEHLVMRRTPVVQLGSKAVRFTFDSPS